MGIRIKGRKTVHLIDKSRVSYITHNVWTMCGLNMGIDNGWVKPLTSVSISKKAATCKSCLKIRTANGD